MEISTARNSTWTSLDAEQLTDPYDGTVLLSSNPLSGARAWWGFQDWTRAVADLSAFAGQTVGFRFRMGTDSGGGGFVGWYFDDVIVQHCAAPIFADGLESGNASAWQLLVPD